MRFVCPNCGRKGSLPDGTSLPPTVGCPACKAAFAPIPIAELVTVPGPGTGACEYCGEAIQPTARKCRHCGEILDPMLRAAQEAKGRATVVVANHVTASAIATPAGGRSLQRQFGRFMLVAVGLCVLGVVTSLASANRPGVGPAPGIGLFAIGMMMIIIGVPIFLFRGLWSWIFH